MKIKDIFTRIILPNSKLQSWMALVLFFDANYKNVFFFPPSTSSFSNSLRNTDFTLKSDMLQAWNLHQKNVDIFSLHLWLKKKVTMYWSVVINVTSGDSPRHLSLHLKSCADVKSQREAALSPTDVCCYCSYVEAWISQTSSVEPLKKLLLNMSIVGCTHF